VVQIHPGPPSRTLQFPGASGPWTVTAGCDGGRRWLCGRSWSKMAEGEGTGKEGAGKTAVAISRGAVAQLGERGLCKPEVVGSIPISSTKNDLLRCTLRRVSLRVLC
jgi:hypothetical protein